MASKRESALGPFSFRDKPDHGPLMRGLIKAQFHHTDIVNKKLIFSKQCGDLSRGIKSLRRYA